MLTRAVVTLSLLVVPIASVGRGPGRIPASSEEAFMISEIRIVTLSVADLERSARFYKQALGYVELGGGKLAGDALEQAWRMPPGLTGRFLMLGPPRMASGLLRLVQFTQPGERIWGDYARIQDLGHFAVNFRVRDLKDHWPRLVEAGAKAKSEPTFWKVNEDLSAWDSQCYDPDGVLLDIFEVQGNLDKTPLGEQTAEVSEVQTMAIHVSDMAKSTAFYTGIGFEVFYDKLIENMEGFFGMPKGTSLHNVNLIMPAGSPNGRVELAQYVGFPGRPLRERAVPPNLGGEAIGGPLELAVPPFGKVALRTFFGPDGETLELFERR